MKVFITGATGVLGRELVRQLTTRGHRVVGTVRSEQSEQMLRALRAETRRVDPFDADALARAANLADIFSQHCTDTPAGTA